MFEGVKRKRFFERDVCGIARIIIPTKQDRNKYVQHCLQTSTVSLICRENLDIIHDVDIDPEILQRISFPDNAELLGSTIVWVNIPVFNRPMVIALLNNKDEMTHLEEGEFCLRRDGEGGSVSIQGKSRNSQININVNSNSGRGGFLRINVGNRDLTGKLEVVVGGSLFLTAIQSVSKFRDSSRVEVNKGETSSKSTYQEITNTYIESRVQDSSSGHKITEEKYSIGDGKMTAVIAEELEKFQHKVLDELSRSVVTTSLGTMPLLNKAQILALKESTKEQYSQYLKIQ